MAKASVKLSAYCATTAAITTVIGPLGPETCVGVPPKTAAKNPTAIALQPGNRTDPAGHSEGKRQWKRYNRGGQPAEKVTAQIGGKRALHG
jgi:hypothetical protein